MVILVVGFIGVPKVKGWVAQIGKSGQALQAKNGAHLGPND